jgi:hypothetical protein
MVGQSPVATPADVIDNVRLASKKNQSAVLLRVEYKGEKRFLAVKLATA